MSLSELQQAKDKAAATVKQLKDDNADAKAIDAAVAALAATKPPLRAAIEAELSKLGHDAVSVWTVYGDATLTPLQDSLKSLLTKGERKKADKAQKKAKKARTKTVSSETAETRRVTS